MRLALVAVGKLRPAYRDACDAYAARLRRYGEFAEVELKEQRAPTPERQRELEAAALLAKVPAGARLVVLDRTGTAWSSEALAAALQRWREEARPVACVLGGSHGVGPQLLAAADDVWSLGPLTLPHELARVVVAEQLYRAWTIVRGEPYHK